jgi:hypothetical protein
LTRLVHPHSFSTERGVGTELEENHLGKLKTAVKKEIFSINENSSKSQLSLKSHGARAKPTFTMRKILFLLLD